MGSMGGFKMDLETSGEARDHKALARPRQIRLVGARLLPVSFPQDVAGLADWPCCSHRIPTRQALLLEDQGSIRGP